jgi:ABC-type transport system involved in multi-copper enzyme maturation permease subunit
MNWHMWLAQIRGVVRLEMKKTFFSRRGFWVYFLALAPVLLFAGRAVDLMTNRGQLHEIANAHAVSTAALESIHTGMTLDEVEQKLGEPYSRRVIEARRGTTQSWLSYTDGSSTYIFYFNNDELRSISTRDRGNFQDDSLIYATFFQFFYLRLLIFFGCVGIFVNLFRGEMMNKSLHFYLLAPMRREVLVAGKFVAGVIAAVVIFCSSTALQLWMFRVPYAGVTFSSLHAANYIGVTALACLGYGSVFLAAGLLAVNPLIPAAVVMLWEAANLFLPAALKKISIIFYLQSLCPVIAPPEKDLNPLLALLINSAEAPPAVLSILGLLIVTALLLAWSAIRARKLEINYSSD